MKTNTQKNQLFSEETDIELSAFKSAGTDCWNFFGAVDEIKIPKKIRSEISRDCNILLKEIHPDIETARELVLITASNLNNTWLIAQRTDTDSRMTGYKKLYSKILQSQVPYKPNTYKRILELLIKLNVIEKGKNYSTISHTSTEYKLTERFFGKGIETYKLKCFLPKQFRQKTFFNEMSKIQTNLITRELLKFYAVVELPSKEELVEELDRLVKIKHLNKAGKQLAWAKSHRKSMEKTSRFVFCEDYLQMFHELTDKFIIPAIGDEKSGGRVTDSFTLMPKIFRNLLKVNGKKLVEADMICLHPNIAISIYGGSIKNLTHQVVAEYCNIDLAKAKTEHLSFFNKSYMGEMAQKKSGYSYVGGMVSSPIFDFYDVHEPTMLENIKREKDKLGYKETTKKLFSKEVQIMTEAIQKLGKMNIVVGYVYDALICQPNDKATVIKVLNESLQKHGVSTTAK